jgi:hypothetical protein
MLAAPPLLSLVSGEKLEPEIRAGKKTAGDLGKIAGRESIGGAGTIT